MARRQTVRGFWCWRPMRRKMLTSSSRFARVFSAPGPCGTRRRMVSWPVGDQAGLCPTLWQMMILSADTSKAARRKVMPLRPRPNAAQTGRSDVPIKF